MSVPIAPSRTRIRYASRSLRAAQGASSRVNGETGAVALAGRVAVDRAWIGGDARDAAPGSRTPECTRGLRTVSRFDPARGEPRPVARRADPAQLEQADDPRALAAVRLEQLEHPRVVAARLAGQRPGHEVGQVEVADAHRVGVAERSDRDLGRRPRPDPRERTSAARTPRRAAGPTIASNQRRPGRDAPDELGAAPFDAERVEGVVGERRERRRRRRQPQAGTSGGPGRRLAVARGSRPTPRPARLLAGHLLLEDRRDERLEDGARPRDADAREPAREVGDHGGWPVATATRLAVEAEQRRDVGERALRAGAPGLGRDRVAGVDRARPWPGRPASASPARRGRAASRIVGSPGPARAARASGARSSGPVERDTVRVGTRAESVTDFVSERLPKPCEWASDATVGQTCDAPESSRAWRSSPCSPRSPSPVRPVRGPPASIDQPDPRPLPASGGRGACPRDGDDDSAPRSGGPVRREPGSRLDAVRAGPANRAAPGSGSAPPSPRPTRGSISQEPVAARPATSRGTARTSTATARPAARR